MCVCVHVNVCMQALSMFPYFCKPKFQNQINQFRKYVVKEKSLPGRKLYTSN